MCIMCIKQHKLKYGSLILILLLILSIDYMILMMIIMII